MTTQGIPIPVSIVGDAAAVAALHRIEDALKGTGRSASESAPKVQTLGDRFAGLATGARHANELAEFMQRLGGVVHSAATRIAELASEQQRLDANSVRLGLNFRQAAEQAGGFVSEMETMTLATSLADRGIRATQAELNALARVGMSRAAATGKDLGEVFDSLTDSVLEGGEEMGKFGGNLLRVADGSHTAGERMRAFVTHAKSVTPAMRTASDEMARFNRAVHDAQRTVASAFAEEFGRLLSLPDAMHNSATNAEDLNTQLRAVGMTAAYVVDLVGNGAGAVLGFIASAVTNIIVGVQTLGAGLAAIRGGPTAMRVAMDRRAEQLLGPESAAAITTQFASERWAAFRRLIDQGGPAARTSETPANMPTLAQARTAAARNRAARNQRDAGSGGGTTATDVELARIEAGLEMAARMSESERAARYGVEYEEIGGVVVGARDIIARLRSQRIDVLRRQTRERRAGESVGDRRQRVAQLNARIDELKQELRDAGESEAATARGRFAAQASQARREYEERIGRPVGGAGGSISERAEAAVGKERGERETVRGKQVTDARLDAQLAQERVASRERRALDERRDNLRSFTDFMEEQYGRQVNLAREGAEGVAMALRAMGSAFSENLVAWAEGTKTFEQAANEMLATTLSTIAKESAQKAAFNVAEGIFALATYRYDAAALHFAAAAGYGALAYGAGYAASAVREAAPKKDEGKDARGGSGSRSAAPMSQGSTTGGGAVVINVAFNGPQYGTGGRMEAARDIAGLINAGAVQAGIQINRLAVGS